jgi:hypothetical protein
MNTDTFKSFGDPRGNARGFDPRPQQAPHSIMTITVILANQSPQTTGFPRGAPPSNKFCCQRTTPPLRVDGRPESWALSAPERANEAQFETIIIYPIDVSVEYYFYNLVMLQIQRLFNFRIERPMAKVRNGGYQMWMGNSPDLRAC